MNKKSNETPKLTLTISCPLDLYVWLKNSQRNVSHFVVKAIEDARRAGDSNTQTT